MTILELRFEARVEQSLKDISGHNFDIPHHNWPQQPHFKVASPKMGVFDFFTSPDAKRKEEVRSGAVVPDRSERKRCWEARDGFYACLDKNNVIDSTKGNGKTIAEKECGSQNKLFEEDCAAAWVCADIKDWMEQTHFADKIHQGQIFQAVPCGRLPKEADTGEVKAGGREQDVC